MKSLLVVGGGLVGLATAWRLLERRPNLSLTLLEKEERLGAHQSTHNSGVLHCGLYYQPGSAKARLAVRGIEQMVEFCRREAVPHEVCGKLVVATRPEEVPRLDELLRRGAANGLRGLRRLEGAELRAYEPHVTGVAGALVPQEGIVDYAAVVDRLAQRVRDRGGRIETGARVKALTRRGTTWRALTPRGEFAGEWLVNCAGLHGDRVAALAGERREVRIVPFRGEYYRLRPDRSGLVRNLIYPVPDPKFPFLGVHFTRLIHGGVEAGPNAVLALAREGYRFSTVNVRDLADALSFAGLWRFLWRHREMVTQELLQSLQRERFCASLQRLVPELRPDDLAPGGAGVRAQAMTPAGQLVQDFHLLRRDHALHVLNAPSPAATASLAIGEEIASIVAT
jgi:L-2-hydroxyglutarate oxidase